MTTLIIYTCKSLINLTPGRLNHLDFFRWHGWLYGNLPKFRHQVYPSDCDHLNCQNWASWHHTRCFPHNTYYYMEESALLGTKPLVDSIRHFIRDPSGVFSVCHLCECRIVQWCHDSRLLLLLNWFLHIIKRTLHVGEKIWILCSRGKNNISLVRFAHSWDIVLATRT